MNDNQNKLSKFWNELKRRKVIGVIIIYATTAFILIQLASMLEAPLRLPEWFDTFIIIFLIIGFPIAIIFSWIFDVSSKGITKTEPKHEKATAPATEKPVPEKSIIVLPFENISSDPEQDYFSDGLTEEIITDLSYIQDLLVISRNSAMNFKGNKQTIKEIAGKVNVRYVLEGSVRKSGNDLRIVAQLIDSLNDSHIWAEKYTGTLDDIFDIQEKVSRSVADSLKIRLSSNEIKKFDNRNSWNSVAYEQYLFARNKIWQATKESIQEAIESLENNIKVIGKNENLLVALGLAYLQYVNAGLDTDLNNLKKAKDFINEAIKINASSYKAFYVKGMIHETKGNIKEAFAAITRSLELNNNDSEALMSYAYLFCLAGYPQKGKESANKAVENDPLNPLIYMGKYWIFLCESRFQELEELSLKLTRLNDSRIYLWNYGYSIALNGNYSKAIVILEQLQYNNIDDPFTLLAGTFKCAITGEAEKLRGYILGLKAAAENDHLFAWYLAQACSYANEKEMALDFLERATRDVFFNYPLFNEIDPFLKNIRGEKRFKKLMEGVKKKWENFKV